MLRNVIKGRRRLLVDAERGEIDGREMRVSPAAGKGGLAGMGFEWRTNIYYQLL
jgi:hypothetical protein